jgi:Rrf2 family protein
VKLSKRTEYALRAIVHLARLDPGQYVQSRDLARQEKLPNKFLESVLLGLKKQGYLESKVGSGGGYKLIPPPRNVTIGQLLKKLEGTEADEPMRRDSAPGEVALHLIEQRVRTATGTVLDEEVSAAGKNRDEMFYI